MGCCCTKKERGLGSEFTGHSPGRDEEKKSVVVEDKKLKSMEGMEGTMETQSVATTHSSVLITQQPSNFKSINASIHPSRTLPESMTQPLGNSLSDTLKDAEKSMPDV